MGIGAWRMDKETSQLGFFRFYQTIIWNAGKRAWDKFGGLGTFIGIVVPIVVAWFTTQHKSIGDFVAKDAVMTGTWIIILFAAVLLFYISREPVTMYNKEVSERESAYKKLDEANETEPNIDFVKFGYETFAPSQITRNVDGKDIYTPDDPVERFYILFRNVKKKGIRTENAENVCAVIQYYNLKSLLEIHDEPYWGGAYNPFDEQTWYKPIIIRSSGIPQALFLVIRKQGQTKLYASGFNSRRRKGFIVSEHELKGTIHYILGVSKREMK